MGREGAVHEDLSRHAFTLHVFRDTNDMLQTCSVGGMLAFLARLDWNAH